MTGTMIVGSMDKQLWSHPMCVSSMPHLDSETLKNLVLPGISAFTILDNHTVKSVDLGSNLFLTADSLGRSCGLCATELLQELNVEVRSNYIDKSLDLILQKDPGKSTLERVSDPVHCYINSILFSM